MTKKLMAILPFLTACTIDIELNFDAALNGRTAEGQEYKAPIGLITAGFDDIDLGQLESELDNSCTVSLAPVEVSPEAIFVEWEIHGHPEETTAVGLFFDSNADGLIDFDEELLHVEFYDLDTVETYLDVPIRESSANQTEANYMVYVASGDDFAAPRCSTQQYLVVESAQPDPTDWLDDTAADDILESQLSACSDVDDVYETYDIVDGESLSVIWDAEWFEGDSVETFIYTVTASGADSFNWMHATTENHCFYDLPVERVEMASTGNEYQEVWGEYGFSIASESMAGCLHYRISIHPNF